MSLYSLFRSQQEAIIEIEEAYIRFLVPDGDSFKSTVLAVTPAEMPVILRQNLAKVLGDFRQVSVVTNFQTGIKVLPFPATMDEKDILEHLQLKREEYFGVKGECEFILKPTANSNKDSRELMVSYIQKSFFSRLQQIFQEEGYTLNRVTNIVETMIGAYQNNQASKSELVCLLAIGYMNISMVVLKNRKPVAVRTTLTGSVKEIETRLMSVLKLNKAAVDDLLSGKTPADQESIELIQQNERELLSRISPFFAFIRSLDSKASSFEILLTMPYIYLPGLPSLLEQNFQAKVLPLETPYKIKNAPEAAKADISWLSGATHRNTLSFTPVRHEFLRFTLTAKLAWMFIVFFMLAPLGMARVSKIHSENRIMALKSQYSEVESLYRLAEDNQASFGRLQAAGELIAAQTGTRKSLLPIIKKLCDLVNDELKLERVNLNVLQNQLTITGLAIDNETALKFWDTLEKSGETANVRINFGEKVNQVFPKFTINAELRK